MAYNRYGQQLKICCRYSIVSHSIACHTTQTKKDRGEKEKSVFTTMAPAAIRQHLPSGVSDPLYYSIQIKSQPYRAVNSILILYAPINVKTLTYIYQ